MKKCMYELNGFWKPAQAAELQPGARLSTSKSIPSPYSFKMAGDSFFAKPSSSKRKQPASSRRTPASQAKPPPQRRAKRDEDLASDSDNDVAVDDMDLTRDTRGGESDDEERVRDAAETGGEKRLRIAREYLRGLEAEQQIGTSFTSFSLPSHTLALAGNQSGAISGSTVLS